MNIFQSNWRRTILISSLMINAMIAFHNYLMNQINKKKNMNSKKKNMNSNKKKRKNKINNQNKIYINIQIMSRYKNKTNIMNQVFK